MEATIRSAAANEVVDLRHQILRAGLPRETAIFPGDDAATARHFVAEQNGAIVGCVTLHLNQHENEPAWQLRGMAVSPALQQQGIGAKLLAAAEESVRSSMHDVPKRMWCNARVPAARFYEKHGWTIVSEVFDIPTAGPHVRMTKSVRES